MATLLLDRGAAVNLPDRAGETPLRLAVENRNRPLGYLLLQHGGRDDATTLYNAIAAGRLGDVSRLLNEYPSLVNMAQEGHPPNEGFDGGSPLTPLHAAVFWGRAEVVRELLRQSADVNALARGETPLHEAVQLNDPVMAALLLDSGADVNGPMRPLMTFRASEIGVTPLLMAAQGASGEVARLLLAHGADVRAKDGAGQTPLDCAVLSGDHEVTALLLQKGVSPTASQLSLALRGQDRETAALLLNAGAPARPLDGEGVTPLERAVGWGDAPTVALLLDKGATVDARNAKGDTPLVQALRFGHSRDDVSELLIARGADIRAAEGRTPLHVAVAVGDLAMVERLVKMGADVNATDAHGRFPIFGVFPAGTPEGTQILQYLRAHGALEDPTSALAEAISANNVARTEALLRAHPTLAVDRDEAGRTPLDWAIPDDRVGLVRLLLNHGADVNSRDAYGFTPLLSAVDFRARDTAALLIRRGADVNATRYGNVNETPLIYALDVNNPETALLLVNAGADVRVAKAHIKTPLHLAAQRGWDALAARLIARGAEVNRTDEVGRTPLDLAVAAQRHSTADLLRRHGGRRSGAIKTPAANP